jgi:enoyl-[acyl-carrier-protein] reductase (NADH)
MTRIAAATRVPDDLGELFAWRRARVMITTNSTGGEPGNAAARSLAAPTAARQRRPRVVLVTGANSGLGFAAAEQLARGGAQIIMVCRDRERGETARARLADVAVSGQPELLFADLSVQADIRRLADEVRERDERIDVLLNNAGGLFAFELARRLEDTTATSNAVSPGPSKTRFGDGLTGAAGLFPKVMKRLPVFRSAEHGARTLVYAASAAELDGVSGRFLFKSREYDTKPVTHDRALAERLWRLSEQLCGLAPAPAGRAGVLRNV